MPVPGPGEVLIKVAAAGVNRPDVIQRYGKYPPPPGASDIPGLEVAGHIAGACARRRAVARRRCRLRARQRRRLCGILRRAAGAMPAAARRGSRSWTRRRFPRRSSPCGPTSSSAGALRAARDACWSTADRAGSAPPRFSSAGRIGARVFATAGSDEKCAACQALGAEIAVNYRTTDWVQAFRDATGGRGVELVLDMVGGDYVARNLELLAVEGRLVQIAFLKSSRVEVDLMQVMRRRLTITGSTLRPRSPEEKGLIARQLHDHVWPLFERGARPPCRPRRVPARSGRRRASHDGRGTAHRQDPADGVASHLCTHLST